MHFGLSALTAILRGVFVLLVIAGSARAGGELFDGCTDSRGKPVPGIVDDALSQVALAATERGKPVLRYNPSRLPALSTRARMFFFAHECALVALGPPAGAERSMARARQADCRALDTLVRSGELAGEGAEQQLEAELRLDERDWEALPGPRRNIDFSACTVKGALRLPDSAAPSDAQSRVNRCVQICGDRLWQCQNRCRDEACRGSCLGAYGSCETGCGGR